MVSDGRGFRLGRAPAPKRKLRGFLGPAGQDKVAETGQAGERRHPSAPASTGDARHLGQGRATMRAARALCLTQARRRITAPAAMATTFLRTRRPVPRLGSRRWVRVKAVQGWGRGTAALAAPRRWDRRRRRGVSAVGRPAAMSTAKLGPVELGGDGRAVCLPKGRGARGRVARSSPVRRDEGSGRVRGLPDTERPRLWRVAASMRRNVGGQIGEDVSRETPGGWNGSGRPGTGGGGCLRAVLASPGVAPAPSPSV